MSDRELPQDVVSLIHHVQLNQHGWWRKGATQVLIGLLWNADKSLTAKSLQKALSDQLNVSMRSEEVQSCLATMLADGTVSEIKQGEFRLSEQSTRELLLQAKNGEAERERAKIFFCQEVIKNCGTTFNADEAWNAFVQELTTAVRQTGANTFNLLTGEQIERREDWLVGFVQRFGSEHIDCLKAVIAGFFSAANPEGKQYVLRLLTAYFFVEATQLSRRTIESIDTKRSKRKLRLYLDTNFLFSVLGLHDNPADDAAFSLLELAKAAHSYIDIKFLVAPHTIDETQRTVHAYIQTAKRVKVSKLVQSVASSAPLPGALRKFFNAAKNADSVYTPEDFFGPYAKNLKTILQQKNIRVDDNIEVSKYRVDQRVIDDVLDQHKREQTRTHGKQKSYEAVEHDVILWYAVHDQRPKHTESPFDAEVWVVTVDTRLAAFDKSKTPRHMGVPTALMPSNLAQLIQFWVPRSEQLEATLLDSLTLPLFFRQFDREDERVTLRILSALSRFANTDDLGVETVRKLLVNDALRHRIEVEDDSTDEEVVALVHEEIIQQNKILSKQALEEKTARKAAEERAANEEQKRKSAEEKVAEVEAAQVLLISKVQLDITNLTASRLKNKFILYYCIGTPVVIAVACFLVGTYWGDAPTVGLTPYWPRLAYLVIGGGLAIIGTYCAIRFLGNHKELSDWLPAQKAKGIGIWLFTFFTVGILPVVVVELFKIFVGSS